MRKAKSSVGAEAALLAASLLLFAFSCGGGDLPQGGSGTYLGARNPVNEDICDCTPAEPWSKDFRTKAKHDPMPEAAAREVSVADILAWEVQPQPAPDALRTGREHQLFRIPRAYLQLAYILENDCDLHLEVSATPEKNAPRIIVETPINSQYCPARQGLKQQLADHGFKLQTNSGELERPLAVQVVGLAFQDYNHPRGSQYVRSVWELHPAVVKVIE